MSEADGSASDALVLHRYRNGGCEVRIHADGTKVREVVDPGEPPRLPEQMDLKITDWCDAGCAWCHEKSTVRGIHGDLDRTLDLLKPLPPGSEIAIGGGDPLSHPGFVEFVRALRRRGLVPSVTVNGRHFERHRVVLERLTAEGSLFGVGFSYHNRLPDWDYEHLVVHLIAGIHRPDVLDAASTSHKVLLLGYKQFGRGKKLFQVRGAEVADVLQQWYRELFVVARRHHLSFDNLAIEQLRPQRLFSDPGAYERRYMGPEGAYSMYLDAVTQTAALSSYSAERIAWSDLASLFGEIRQCPDRPVSLNVGPRAMAADAPPCRIAS